MNTAAENKAVARRFLEELISEDKQELIDELVAQDYVYRDADGHTYHGRSGFREVLGLYRRAFPDLSIEIHRQVAEGDTVATWFTFSGTHRGQLQGIEPTGEKMSAMSVQFSTIEDGQVTEEFDLVDQFTMLDELGAIHIQQSPDGERPAASPG